MPKLVLKSGYIKAGKAGGYMKYIATRERVEKLEGSGPVTKKQQELIQSLLRDFPDTGELHEYADYTAAPTVGSASALITMALDLNAEEVQTRDGYMKYIATRPRVERQGEHGLFSSAASVSLDAALKELEAHKGNVWTLICSLRREDAQRLGYDRADAWRNLLRSQQVEMANALKISPDKLHWYAAFHDEDTHPHIHVMAWSADPKQGYLTKEGIGELRSRMTGEIFRDELLQLYQEKDQSYKEVAKAAREAMRGLLRELERSVCASPELGQQLEALALSLAETKGKKQYGYLRKPVKEQVDRIVDALAELPPVAECYEAWNLCRDALEGYYRDKERECLPLSQQKEFRAVKNMVIQEADRLRRGELSFEDEGWTEEPIQEQDVLHLPDEDGRAYYWAKAVLQDDRASREEKTEAVEVLEELAEEGSDASALLLGKAWRDGLCAPPWEEEAARWFRLAAEDGNAQAQYALGTLLLEQRKDREGIDWLQRAARQGNGYAMYRLGKETLLGQVIRKDVDWALRLLQDAAERGCACAQYTLGKLCLEGKEVVRDPELAEYWLREAAEQSYRHANILLHLPEKELRPSVVLAATRLMHHLGRIFRDTLPQPPGTSGIRMDRKRARQLMEKRLAMGHKPDDHEEQQQAGPTMNAPW